MYVCGHNGERTWKSWTYVVGSLASCLREVQKSMLSTCTSTCTCMWHSHGMLQVGRSDAAHLTFGCSISCRGGSCEQGSGVM